MRKFILLLICLLLAFYLGWPLWSAYRLHTALEANDAQALEGKVDFPSVRESLKPTITAEVDRALERAVGGIGGQLLGAGLKQQLTPQLVENILQSVITPQSIGNFYARRGDLKEILADRMAKIGGGLPGIGGRRPEPEGSGGTGAGGQTPETKPASPGGAKPKEEFGIGNVKRFAFTGPLAFEVGVARDKAAAGPDIVAQLGFRGFDWKLIGLIPRPRAGT